MTWKSKGKLQLFAPREQRVHNFRCVPAAH